MNLQQRRRAFRRVAAITMIAGVALSACGGDDAATPPAVQAAGETAAFGLVSPQQALELSTRDDITVIDVRTPEEFGDGHIEGATMIDFYADTFADEIAELDPDGTYLLYCRSGNRSGQTAILMQQLGFDRVYDMDGGIVAYGGQGLPLVP